MLQSHRSIVEKENLDYQVGCMENVSAGSTMTTFWENSGHTFFLFCLSILLVSLYPPHAGGVWGQAHLSLLRCDQEHNESQGKESGGPSPHSLPGTKPPSRAYTGVRANPHLVMGGQVCLETVSSASSWRNIGFSGSSSLSPVPHTSKCGPME